MAIRIIDKGMKRIIKRSNPANGELATRVMRDLADVLIEDIRKNWSPISPSSPGQPPAKVTGFLDAHITKHKKAQRNWHVTGDADYAAQLERGYPRPTPAARPFMTPAALRVGADVVQHIRGSIDAEMKGR